MTISRAKLIKLLNLTQSPNDHEALSAIRFVNRLLKKHELSWDDVIIPVETNSLQGLEAEETIVDEFRDLDLPDLTDFI